MDLSHIKSKRGAVKRRDQIVRQCYRDMAGGTQYGIDMPTIRATWPERFEELQALQTLFPTLPD